MKKWLSALLYLASILLANITVDLLGIVELGGVSFPAGVVFVGLTFSFRDLTQRTWGDWQVWYWMLIASVITALFNWHLAIASLSAFLVSETVDWFVFKVLKLHLRYRIMLANLFAVPLDSLIFVYIAFGWLPEVMFGQSVIKYLSGLLILPFIWNRR